MKNPFASGLTHRTLLLSSRATALLYASLVATVMLTATEAIAAGEREGGARAFRACAACHSLEPGRHLTGPSLAGLWGRKAGAVEGFTRYSPALKAADFVWSEGTLDAWLADPQTLVPGNLMTFPGIKDRQVRADLIALLKEAGAEGTEPSGMPQGGMMRGSAPQDLKALGPSQQVVTIRYCGDTYQVTTAGGETLPFWEFNLRFKTDSSDKGPLKGHPVLLPASMMGDRAFVIFAAPAEISAFVDQEC